MMYRKSTHETLAMMAAAALISAACGGTDGGVIDERYTGEPIGTLSGTLTAQNPASVTGAVSLAMIWLTQDTFERPIQGIPRTRFTCDLSSPPPSTSTTFNNVNWVSQSVTFQAQFPLSFTVPIHQLPPVGTRIDLQATNMGTGEMSIGMLVAYVDVDTDGVLDLPSPTVAGDEIISISTDQLVVYLNGTYDNSAEFLIFSGTVPQGLSILAEDPVSNQNLFRGALSGITMQVGSNNPLFDLFLRSMCTSVEYREVYDEPRSANASISCKERSYNWLGQAYGSNPCITLLTAGRECLALNDPIPSDWPCN